MSIELSRQIAAAWSDSEFWEKAWEADWNQSLLQRQQRGQAGGECWDRRAARFTAQTQDNGAVDRVMKVVHMLGHKDALKKESQVLDIGSGPGNYSIPIARRVHQVTALDPSGVMLETLRRRAEEAELSNLKTVQQAWEKVNLDESGWRGAFDVVLALMAPPLNGVSNLKKMLAACRGVFIAGGHLRREDPVRRELWQELGLGEMPGFCPDPFYVYHWLYASGYFPDLETEHYYSLRQLTPTEAQAELEDSLYPYLDLTPVVRERIMTFVVRRARDGLFMSARSSVIGWVVCAVGAPLPEDEQIHTHIHDHAHDHTHHYAHDNDHHHDHDHDHHHDHDHDHHHDHDHDHHHDHDHG